MKLVTTILLMLSSLSLVLANVDSTKGKYEQNPGDSLGFIGKYRRVEERNMYQRHVDSVRGYWGGGDIGVFPPICTYGAPPWISVVEFLQLKPEGKLSKGMEGGAFGSDEGLWQRSGDTITVTAGGRKNRYLISGKKLLDLTIRLNIDAQGNKEIYYSASGNKYYLKVTE